MIVKNLYSALTDVLPQVTEMWVAVALLNENGLSLLNDIPANIDKQHYLIGVDLPTNPAALTVLKDKIMIDKFEAAIFFDRQSFFHPKVYLLQLIDKKIAFVGSGNLTAGGLSDNVEMAVLVEDQNDCSALLSWFNSLWKRSFPLDDKNILEYSHRFNPAEEEAFRDRRRNKNYQFWRPADVFNIDDINFTNSYFNREHHFAFREAIQSSQLLSANTERKKTSERFYELHNEIYHRFAEHGLETLHRHHSERNIVSLYYHAEGYTSKELGAMWLSYGKHPDEIKAYQNLFLSIGGSRNRKNKEEDPDRDLQSFINHARIQIRIDVSSIAFSILFAKGHGSSQFDRQHFFEHMKTENYRHLFFEEIQKLPESYWIQVNSTSRPVHSFQNPELLHAYCKSHDEQKYFVIGRTYQLGVPELSKDLLPATTLLEFKRMLPLYSMMKHTLNEKLYSK